MDRLPLLVSKMLLQVRKDCVGTVPLARFMEQPTIASLARMLTDKSIKKGEQVSVEVFTDMVLDADIVPLREYNHSIYTPKEVLLTGANGFVGVFILQQLLLQTDAVIHCLIRSLSKENGCHKLNAALEQNGLSGLINHPRIRIVPGDLEQPSLGLAHATLVDLARKVDVIFHNGANVNHVIDYHHLANANVRSTLELLRLATSEKNKAIHYISTLSAASNLSGGGRIVEEGPAKSLPLFINNAYNLTKWVSEHLIWQALERGVEGTIIRPGNITGHSVTGICHPSKNRIMLLLKGAIELGCVPAWETGFDLCPVDFLAEGIVRCSLSATRETPVLHFHHPNPLTWLDFVNYVINFGYRLEVVAPAEWQMRVTKVNESNALYKVLSFYLDENNEDIGDMSCIDHHKTTATLLAVGMSYPKNQRSLVERNLCHLGECGFLPVPAAAIASEQAL